MQREKKILITLQWWSTDQVQALLAGLSVQTRRCLSHQVYLVWRMFCYATLASKAKIGPALHENA
jgi:hypothetical protein